MRAVTHRELDSLRLVEDPAGLLRSARFLAFALVLSAFLALVVPWQQTALGEGTVTAWAPAERRQTVDAPISGRVLEWHVQEGDTVAEGELLVTLTDNDPELVGRLERERETVLVQEQAYLAKLTATQDQLLSLEGSLEQADARLSAEVNAAEQERDGAAVKRDAAMAEASTAELQAARIDTLYERGLASQREHELAQLSLTKARADVDRAKAELEAKTQSLAAKRAARNEKLAELRAKLQEVSTKLQDATTGEAEARAKLLQVDSKLAKQNNRQVRAPRAGQVLRVVGGTGQEQVKAGDHLVMLVPDASQVAVELYVDGRDMPLLRRDQPVRLQLEGWPALQFAGWPSVSVGTFGGLVSAIDPADDGSGRFRVWVTPDPEDEAWPSDPWLRQGVRAKGWVLLAEVPLGFELWRQINGFPPAVDRSVAEKEAKPPIPLPKGK